MKNNIYVDFHVIQTVPPSCVNRDDTGSPKTAMYGGVTRARVSSQSWKHAVRLYFAERFPDADLGKRTKNVISILATRIREISDMDEEASENLARLVLETAKAIPKKKSGETSKTDKNNKTDVLLFISEGQINALADFAVNHKEGKFSNEDKSLCKQCLKDYPSIDIALFGRMVAKDASLNFDAACQVAHAISTHAVHNEYDYFTAVDDCTPEDNAGAGHLGTVEYNSATLYRYATVNIRELEKHLKNDTAIVIREFAEAFVCSMPTGKQNTFANRTLPDAVYITIRDDQPVNMSGAFERPIYAGKGGYVELSKKALSDYAKSVYGNFVKEPDKAFIIGDGLELAGEKKPFSDALEALKTCIQEKVEVDE